MGHKCFISFKTQDLDYKEKLQSLAIDMIDKSLNKPIDSEDEDYVMQIIRKDHLSDSTVTIHLIGQHCAENNLNENQSYIKRELQASLYNGKNNSKNGILGIVLPDMYSSIYLGKRKCPICNNFHNTVAINKDTVVTEFAYNYYIPKNSGCAWSENERYCVLVKWDDFIKEPETYINQAFDKRNSEISKKTKVRP